MPLKVSQLNTSKTLRLSSHSRHECTALGTAFPALQYLDPATFQVLGNLKAGPRTPR